MFVFKNKQTNKQIFSIFLREHDFWSAFSTNPTRHLHLNESPSLMQMCWQVLFPCAHTSKPENETGKKKHGQWLRESQTLATERGPWMLGVSYVSTSSHPGSTRIPLDTGRRTSGRCWHTGADSCDPGRKHWDQRNLQRRSMALTTAIPHRKWSAALGQLSLSQQGLRTLSTTFFTCCPEGAQNPKQTDSETALSPEPSAL